MVAWRYQHAARHEVEAFGHLMLALELLDEADDALPAILVKRAMELIGERYHDESDPPRRPHLPRGADGRDPASGKD